MELTIAGNSRIPAVTFPLGDPLTGPYGDELPMISDFLDGWQTPLSKAGVSSVNVFNFDEVWTADEARCAVEMLLNPTTSIRLEFKSFDGDNHPNPFEALLFRTCSFGGTSLTYSAKITFEHTSDPIWLYRSARFEALDVRPEVQDLDEYGFNQGEAREVNLLLDQRSLNLDRRGQLD